MYVRVVAYLDCFLGYCRRGRRSSMMYAGPLLSIRHSCCRYNWRRTLSILFILFFLEIPKHPFSEGLKYGMNWIFLDFFLDQNKTPSQTGGRWCFFIRRVIWGGYWHIWRRGSTIYSYDECEYYQCANDHHHLWCNG